jgi:hypothetical protein
MRDDRDQAAISTWEHGEEGRYFGGRRYRREPDAICYECGEPVIDRPFFGDATCGAAACRERAAERAR